MTTGAIFSVRYNLSLCQTLCIDAAGNASADASVVFRELHFFLFAAIHVSIRLAAGKIAPYIPPQNSGKRWTNH
jgi:hypothetical protein